MDSQQIIVSILGLANALTLFLLSRIKRDTAQVNTAVNHVEPGKLTLTQRIDVIGEDVDLLKARRMSTDADVKANFALIFEKHRLS